MSALADATADQLAMLLSTDWFLPHWRLIGIDAGSNDIAFQQRCRGIVRNLIGEASEYYHISFTETRLATTRMALVRAAAACVPTAGTERIEQICTPDPYRDEKHKTAWVLLDVVGPEMLQDQDLEPTIRTALNGAKQWFKFDSELLNRQCVESPTDWDSYIRRLTPEQPSALFDFVAAGLIVEAQFAFVLNQLTTTQRDSLLTRCRNRRSQITGVPESDLW